MTFTIDLYADIATVNLSRSDAHSVRRALNARMVELAREGDMNRESGLVEALRSEIQAQQSLGYDEIVLRFSDDARASAFHFAMQTANGEDPVALLQRMLPALSGEQR